jgi:hypothetical protein
LRELKKVQLLLCRSYPYFQLKEANEGGAPLFGVFTNSHAAAIIIFN